MLNSFIYFLLIFYAQVLVSIIRQMQQDPELLAVGHQMFLKHQADLMKQQQHQQQQHQQQHQQQQQQQQQVGNILIC
jgi:hypothetical protein